MKRRLMIVIAVLTLALSVGISEASDINFIGSAELPINLGGDTAILYNMGWCNGIGIDMVSWKEDLITLRGELLWPYTATTDAPKTIAGAAVMIDVAKALGYTKGTWKLGPIQPKIGPVGGYDFSNQKFVWGGLLQVLRITIP